MLQAAVEEQLGNSSGWIQPRCLQLIREDMVRPESSPAMTEPETSPTPADEAPLVEPPAGDSPARVRLFNRDFVLLWQGQLVSRMGSQAMTIAMMFWTMEATGSATLMGAMMMVGTLPAVVLGPLAGTLADRVSRKWILVFCDAGSGLVLLGAGNARKVTQSTVLKLTHLGRV